MGVKSPTTKKHAELVKEIELAHINNNRTLPTKKGRPSKQYFLLNDGFPEKIETNNKYIMVDRNEFLLVLNYVEKIKDILRNLLKQNNS